MVLLYKEMASLR